MIFWIFGGTAVGKKRFIQQCLQRETRPEFLWIQDNVKAEWIADGPLAVNLVDLFQKYDILVRWQWGREEHLKFLLKHHPEIQNSIVLLSCGLMPQLSRVALREGFLKWDAEMLHGEMLTIYECVHDISRRYPLPVLYVDTGGANQYELRKRIG